ALVVLRHPSALRPAEGRSGGRNPSCALPGPPLRFLCPRRQVAHGSTPHRGGLATRLSFRRSAPSDAQMSAGTAPGGANGVATPSDDPFPAPPITNAPRRRSQLHRTAAPPPRVRRLHPRRERIDP